MQSNLSSTFGTTICYNGNPSLNFLQIQQQQQNLLNASQLNASNPNLIAQPSVEPQTQPQNDTTFTKIFVGGLPYHTTDESLRNFFSKFGNIEEAVVINDRQTGKSRGYGFVTMETKEAAEAAIQDPNPIIDGRKANVNLAYLGVKSRSLAQNSIIPLIRYQIPPTATQTAFGFHPFYYHPAATAAAAVQAQPTFGNTFLTTTTPNLLISTQNTQIPPPTPISPNKAALLTSAYDLTSAYAAAAAAAAAASNANVATTGASQLNTNRQSPFDPTQAALTANNLMPNTFLQPYASTNQTAFNSILNQTQSNVNYFALPQFQSQLQDRL